MKKKILTSALILMVIIGYSQKVINLTYSPVKKEILEKTERIRMKIGESYIVKVNGVNSTLINEKLEDKAYILSSNTPGIIQPIFPGIPESYFLDKSIIGYDTIAILVENRINEVYIEAIDKYKVLNDIKLLSDSLYKKTKNAPSISASIETLQKAKMLLGAVTDEDLKKKTSLLVYYVLAAKDLYKLTIDKSDIDNIIDEKLLGNYSTLNYICEQLTNNNFTKYINFIIESQEGKPYIESELIVAKKDIVDLNIVFVNTYLKDTVYNDKLTFYTEGSFSFDFSSGFFYNNLTEKSYYLERRDFTLNNILEESNISFDVAFGALGHISYKFTNSVRAGFSMGAALSPLDGKMRYLLGVSLLLGRRNQLGLNAGLSLAKFKVLSKSVKEDVVGKYVSSEVTSVPTYDKLINGIYFGITYNITSKRK